MKKLLTIVATVILLSSCSQNRVTIVSPNGKLAMSIAIDNEGQILYTVSDDGQQIMQSSRMGLVRNDYDFSTNMTLKNVGKPTFYTENYNMLSGKRSNITVEANRQTIEFVNANGQNMNIEVHAANHGIAFRYSFTDTTDTAITITNECTTFSLDSTARAWMHPQANVKDCWARTCPSYEDNYLIDIPVGTPSPYKGGWSFPALFNVSNRWLLITEAGLTPEYCATRLEQNPVGGTYKVGFPMIGETINPDEPNMPSHTLPMATPWRVIIAGKLADIVESTIVDDLSEATQVADAADFVIPGAVAWSWGLEKDNSVNYERQKQYIDYASYMGWPYVLIDGLWDTTIGYDRIAELAKYAECKNVGIILWYNSAGDWNDTYQTPKDKMLNSEIRNKEFDRLNAMGIKGLKIDFFPGDGQSTIKYYYDILTDAAKHHLLINFHGTTLPRGWSRTFPNLLTQEAVKGLEFITFSQETADKAPEHCAMLPFARNVVGPMDFTPVCLDKLIPENITRRTTSGFELALSVVFQSGWQHFVEIPERMMAQPECVQNFMKTVPTAWDDTRYIDGYPAKFAVIARKKGDKWYIGGINATNDSKEISIDFKHYGINTEVVDIITDGDEPYSLVPSEVIADNRTVKITIKPNGGFVMTSK